MALYQLALIVKNLRADDFQFLAIRQKRPSPEKFDGLPFVDKELWDLPSASLPLIDKGVVTLSPLEIDESVVEIAQNVRCSLEKIGLKGFNVVEAISKIYEKIHPIGCQLRSWRYWKLMEESEFGPGPPLHTILFISEGAFDGTVLQEGCKWLDPESTMSVLVQTDVQDKRIGPLAALAVSPHVSEGLFVNFGLGIHGQEYPPGVVVVPMDSMTLKPFNKTNLIIFSPSVASKKETTSLATYAAVGDALISDAGAYGAAQSQLAEIVRSLPRKLIVFVTHHHLDHTDGLQVVKKQNPEVVLVAHELTIQRLRKAAKGFKCIAVKGGSKLLIAGHEVEVIAAPGHTEGHLAFYNSSTGILVAGDHCVGQGSSVLDATAGGNMKEYLDTTRRFLELKPHIVVPMHGRPNIWPAHMLNGYIKHREERENKILNAIKSGSKTAFEVVSQAYADTSPKYWPAALQNVKLHIEHLQECKKLPSDFSIDKFEQSSNAPFLLRCLPAYAKTMFHGSSSSQTPARSVLMSVCMVVFVGAVAYLWAKRKS